jgi:hypothetical protein
MRRNGIGKEVFSFQFSVFSFFGGEGQQGVDSANIEDEGQPVAAETGGQS